MLEEDMKGEEGDIHLSTTPLHLLNDIQTAVHNKLVHMPSLLREPCDAIAALLRSPELILEKRIILRANNGKVVRHFSSVPRGAEKLKLSWGLKGRLGEARSDWLREMVLALIILCGTSTSDLLYVQKQHDVRSLQTYERVIGGSSMVCCLLSLFNWGFGVLG